MQCCAMKPVAPVTRTRSVMRPPRWNHLRSARDISEVTSVRELVNAQKFSNSRSPVDAFGAGSTGVKVGSLLAELLCDVGEISRQSLRDHRTKFLGERWRRTFGRDRYGDVSSAVHGGEVEVGALRIINDVQPDSFAACLFDDAVIHRRVARRRDDECEAPKITVEILAQFDRRQSRRKLR